jgi:hypothetical protein
MRHVAQNITKQRGSAIVPEAATGAQRRRDE